MFVLIVFLITPHNQYLLACLKNAKNATFSVLCKFFLIFLMCAFLIKQDVFIKFFYKNAFC